MIEIVEDLPTQKHDWNVYKNAIEQMKKSQSGANESEAVSFARTFCNKVIHFIWRSVDYRKKWKCRQLTFDEVELNIASLKLAKSIAEYFTSLNIMEYSYLIGSLYTMLLPDGYRSDNGIYYTPPALAERLLDILSAEGADWANAEILDPACGGGAFLVTVAGRVLSDYRIREMSAEEKLNHLEQHLAGIELDKFAAFLTQCLLDIIVYPESINAGRRLKPLVKVRDTVQYALIEKRRFDVIVGNPPYGKIKLDDTTREKYSRSLYGHANLYGVFIDASVRLIKKNGLVGFVTPTSFLGGKYFSNLRNFLSHELPPLAIDFLSMRNGVFDQVLQETCLAVFGNNPAQMVTASKFNVETTLYSVERIGSFKIEKGTAPWLIARETAEAKIISGVKDIGITISDYGYKVSTGQFVWNRLKNQIFAQKESDVNPIIWAEAVTAAGSFDFNYVSRKEKKYVKITDKQKFLLCNQSVVLVQRTTAKEQKRRLQACILPQDFIDKWNGVVIENHVNIIRPLTEKPKVSLEVLLLLLNSSVVDRVFRCLSGSVAVSASELHALLLPPVENLGELEKYAVHLQNHSLNTDTLEKIIMRAYRMEE